MNERERLISIIEKARAEAVGTIGSMNHGFAVWYADKLMESGVAPVVHGEWVPCENGGYFCSSCDSRVAFRFDNFYCPHCGAKMDGG